jgi:hypothetical protein
VAKAIRTAFRRRSVPIWRGDPPDPHVTVVALEGDRLAVGVGVQLLAVVAGLEGGLLAARAGVQFLAVVTGQEGALASRRGGAGAC